MFSLSIGYMDTGNWEKGVIQAKGGGGCRGVGGYVDIPLSSQPTLS